MTNTGIAIEIRKSLRRASELFTELMGPGVSDEEDAILYDWQKRIGTVSSELTETPAIGRVYDRQKVIDETLQ